MNRHRYRFLSIVQLISAIFVVLKHAIPDSAALDTKAYNAFLFVANVMCLDHIALAAFMITSGALAGMTMERGVRPWEYIKKRAIRLLVPYFCVNTLLFVPKALLSRFLVSNTELSIVSYLKMIVTPRAGSSANLWFLPPLFVFCALSPFLFRLGKKHVAFKIALLLAALGALAIPNLTDVGAVNDLKKYLFIYLLGLFFYDAILRLENIKTALTLVALPASVVALGLLFFVKSNPYTYTAYVLSGAVAVYSASILLSRVIRRELYVERKTFAIYIISLPAQTVIDVLCGLLKINPWITAAAMLVVGAVAPIVICLVMDAIRAKTRKKFTFLSVVFGV